MNNNNDRHEPHFTVGYDLGSVGAWLRLALGVALSGYFLAGDAAEDLTDPGVAAATVAAFIGIVLVYLAAFWWLGPRLLARASPWVGTTIFYGPVLLFAYLDLPEPVDLALGAYVAISTLVVVLIRYGGCEVIGIPMLLLGRRYVVYCPWNLHADVTDKVLADSSLAASVRGVGPKVTAAVAIAAVTVAFAGIGPLPELRWELRLLFAAAAGPLTVALWAAGARLLDRASEARVGGPAWSDERRP